MMGELNASALLPAALDEKVAFVPGSAFYVRDPRHSSMRLNYSNRPPELIREGIARLGKVLRSHLTRRGAGRSRPLYED